MLDRAADLGDRSQWDNYIFLARRSRRQIPEGVQPRIRALNLTHELEVHA
jgi:hypothetical protein